MIYPTDMIHPTDFLGTLHTASRCVSAGQVRRERGQRRVLDNTNAAWKERVLHELRVFCEMTRHQDSRQFAFEVFREWATKTRGLPEPFSHNVWGAISRLAVREGIMRWTGQYQPARSARTHAHPVKVWEAV